MTLTPNEFADFLIEPNMSALTALDKRAPVAEIAPDLRFPIKNAPLETYVNHSLKFAEGFSPRYENATIGGDRAIKVYIQRQIHLV